MSIPRHGEFRQFIGIDVRWGDMDAMGHVNNAKYFTFEESARIAYWEPFEREDQRFWKDYGLILASNACDFLAQVHYPAQLQVGTRIARIGRSSMNTVSAIFQGERVVAALRGTVVWFSYAEQKTLPVPEHVRAWIRSREALAPEE